MKVQVTKLAKSKAKLNISEEANIIQKYFDEAYQKLAPLVDIKGFRPGKAPKLITIQTIGENKYQNEALNLALPMVYSEAVKSEKLIPVAPPKINIVEFGEGKTLRLEAEIELLPEVQLGDYKNVKVKHKEEKFEASDEEVDKIIKRLQYQDAQYIVTSESAKKGDRMEIDFVGKVKNVELEKYTSKHYPFLLGEGALLPEFEKKLLGTKKGDELKFNIDVKSPAGTEKVDFEVKINEVWEVKLPELTDQFAQKFGNKTVKILRENIAKNIILEKEQRDRQILEDMIMTEVLKKVKIEVGESLIEQEIERRIKIVQEQTGPGFNRYLESLGKDLAQFRETLKPAAERSVKISLSLSEIAKDMGYFKPEKLGKDMKENQRIQGEAVKKTMDELIKITTK